MELPLVIQSIIFQYVFDGGKYKKALYHILEEHRRRHEILDLETVKWLCDVLRSKKENFRGSNLRQFLFQDSVDVVKFLREKFDITSNDTNMSFSSFAYYANEEGLFEHVKYFNSLTSHKLELEWILHESNLWDVAMASYVCDEYKLDHAWIQNPPLYPSDVAITRMATFTFLTFPYTVNRWGTFDVSPMVKAYLMKRFNLPDDHKIFDKPPDVVIKNMSRHSI